jgi:DNA-binding NarL/FixJ family response regulator
MIRRNDEDSPRLPFFNGSGSAYPRMVSVLLVFDNPVYLDRICHLLEKKGDIMVDIRVSEEDAIHLMHYVPFDVIVTEYLAGQSDRISLLKTMRSRSMYMPVIYYSRYVDIATEDETGQYAPAYFVARNTTGSVPELDDLYPVIIQAVSEKRRPAL